MRVCLDTRNTGRQGGTGIATYTRSIASACSRSGHEPVWLDDGAACHRHPGRIDARLIRQMRALQDTRTAALLPSGNWLCPDLYRTSHIRFRQTARLTTVRSHDNPDIVHWTTVLPVIWPGPPNIVTVHDLIPLTHPNMTGIDSTKFRQMLHAVCHRAACLVTISEAVRNDILHHCPVSPDNVVNLSQPVDLPDLSIAERQRTPQIIPPDGFLYFGSIERRKNIERLILAHKRSNTDRCLTLIGKPGFGLEHTLDALIRDLRPAAPVKVIPWVERPALIRAISEARAIVFPSLAEGFGLPIIEAMHLGTPVMTSLGHATEEIAGGAALLVEPDNTDSITTGIRMLAADDDLCRRLTALGHERVRRFSQDAFMHRLDAVYRAALNRGSVSDSLL